MPVEATQHNFLQCARLGAVLPQLLVVLGDSRLHTGRHAPIAPIGTLQDAAGLLNFINGQDLVDVLEHGDGFAV